LLPLPVKNREIRHSWNLVFHLSEEREFLLYIMLNF
jgi:hypothetical protein